jgi:hypothetical protein
MSLHYFGKVLQNFRVSAVKGEIAKRVISWLGMGQLVVNKYTVSRLVWRVKHSSSVSKRFYNYFGEFFQNISVNQAISHSASLAL